MQTHQHQKKRTFDDTDLALSLMIHVTFIVTLFSFGKSVEIDLCPLHCHFRRIHSCSSKIDAEIIFK
jgi:hypothetical protein